MEHVGRSTLKVCSDARTYTHTTPALAYPGQTEFHFGSGKKVKIFRFAIKVVELVGVSHMTISA